MRLIKIKKAEQREEQQAEDEQEPKEKRTQNTAYVQVGSRMLERNIS